MEESFMINVLNTMMSIPKETFSDYGAMQSYLKTL
jgi:hypothetical protein